MEKQQTKEIIPTDAILLDLKSMKMFILDRYSVIITYKLLNRKLVN